MRPTSKRDLIDVQAENASHKIHLLLLYEIALRPIDLLFVGQHKGSALHPAESINNYYIYYYIFIVLKYYYILYRATPITRDYMLCSPIIYIIQKQSHLSPLLSLWNSQIGSKTGYRNSSHTMKI